MRGNASGSNVSNHSSIATDDASLISQSFTISLFSFHCLQLLMVRVAESTGCCHVIRYSHTYIRNKVVPFLSVISSDSVIAIFPKCRLSWTLIFRLFLPLRLCFLFVKVANLIHFSEREVGKYFYTWVCILPLWPSSGIEPRRLLPCEDLL